MVAGAEVDGLGQSDDIGQGQDVGAVFAQGVSQVDQVEQVAIGALRDAVQDTYGIGDVGRGRGIPGIDNGEAVGVSSRGGRIVVGFVNDEGDLGVEDRGSEVDAVSQR